MTTHLTTATPSLADSEMYFKMLGFTKVSASPVLFSDGKALIEVDPDRFARPGIKVHRPSWSDLLGDLEPFGPIHERGSTRLVAAPSGTWVYLVEEDAAAAADMASAEPSVLGSYAGISMETTRMADSLRFWELFGFSVSAGGADQGWLSMADADGFSISLMSPFSCPHMFRNPSLTYFNSGSNPEIIAEIRRREISILEEVTVFNKSGEVDNVILEEPGGCGFFVFND